MSASKTSFFYTSYKDIFIYIIFKKNSHYVTSTPLCINCFVLITLTNVVHTGYDDKKCKHFTAREPRAKNSNTMGHLLR